MKILVDSSVLLDVLTQDPHWAAWSEEKLAAHAERDLLAINPIIYAEVSGHFSTRRTRPGAFSRRFSAFAVAL
jgi:predicted nucleic acid-binding protein